MASMVTTLAKFIIGTCFFVLVSWRPLHNPKSHGFYRFFVFEGILLLFILNSPYWFKDMFSPLQLLSWFMLFSSLFLAAYGYYRLKRSGGSMHRSEMPENFKFENTSHLVTDGIYGYIRHPMYTSLMLLAWGIFFKHITLYTTVLSVLVTILIIFTAKTEEDEDIRFFGEEYREYIKHTWMFFPFIF